MFGEVPFVTGIADFYLRKYFIFEIKKNGIY